MSFRTLLFTYVLGGLTFLPLVLIAILVPAWRLLPTVEDPKKSSGNDDKVPDGEKKRAVVEKIPNETEEAGASGTFAVLRKYDLPAALAALNARNHAGGNAGAAGTDNGEAADGNESVYQSVYRSVFDRNKATSSILENEDAPSNTTTTRTGKRSTPANVFYIVLRHGHLMLYDSTAEREVRHVLSLAHYTISISSGPAEPDGRDMKDGELFIKRTAIVLTPTSAPAKPFYLFSAVCIENEDFYHALLSTRDPHPIPQPLDTDSVIKLQSMLHSNSALSPETRAINALISRIFLALHQTDRLKTLIRSKIEKKISRVQKPAFIASLVVQSIDLGDAAPILSNLRLKDLNISGDMTMSLDVKYTGGIKFTFAALAKLDLGPRFKTRTADLLLSTSLQRLQGHMLLRIKPSPSNRIWFCFDTIPEMDIKVEPVVSQRQITYTFILRAIEDRIRAVVGETLVKPNWDDVPFLDTRDRRWRGGIWTDGSDEDVPPESPPSDLRKRHQKTMSMPSLGNIVTENDSSGASSGSETMQNATTLSLAKEGLNDLKRRSVNSLPLPSTPERDTQSPSPSAVKPLRTPSLTTPPATTPSVQLDENHANFDPSRSDSASDQLQQQKKWRILPSVPQQGTRRDAIESIRAMRDRTMAGQDTEDDQHGIEDAEHGVFTAEPSEMDGVEGRQSSESSAPSLAGRSLRPVRRNDTNASTSTNPTTRSQRQQEAMQKGKTIFAATAAATNAATAAAKTWGWNTLANRTGKGGQGVGQGQQQGPLGRGQPLPPPGMPLPGPQKGWLPSGMGSMKRKPVLPPRKSTTDTSAVVDRRDSEGARTDELQQTRPSEGSPGNTNAAVSTPSSEFGPWRENSGTWPGSDINEALQAAHESTKADLSQNHTTDSLPNDDQPTESAQKNAPPPLPARRHSSAGHIHPLSFEPSHVVSKSEAHNAAETPGSLDQPKDVIDDANATNEEANTTKKPAEPTDLHMSDEDDLVAISAPVEEDADEAQLEAEGVQQDDPVNLSTSDDDSSALGDEAVLRHSKPADDDGEYRYGSRNDLESEAASA